MAKTYLRTGRISWSPLTSQEATWYALVSAYGVGTTFSATLDTDAAAWLTGEGVIALVSPGGSGSQWNVVSPTEDYAAAAGDFVVVNPGILVSPCTVVEGSRTLTTTDPVFTNALIGRTLDDFWFGDGHVLLGTQVQSVESSTSLTMTAPAAAADSADAFQFEITITLPAPSLNARVGIDFAAPGGGLAVSASSGSLPYFPDSLGSFKPGTGATAVFIGDGVDWQLESFYAGPPPPLWVANYPPVLPLPQGAQRGREAYWSTAANGGQGGWVQDSTIELAVGFHSSSDAGDILAGAPFQTLKASWVSTAFGGQWLSGPKSLPLFGYVDHIPAGGHAGLQLQYEGNAGQGTPEFDVQMFGTYGVIRLDGTASCVVSTTDPPPNVPTSLTVGSYNADSTMMDWAGASIKGSDLTADATNNWIHSAAGGLVYIFSTLGIAPTEDDFPVFS